jgi:hypothetical protein
MAKTDSIFIRRTTNLGNVSTFVENTIDLGAFVDPLGKSVARLLSIQVAYTDANGTTVHINDDESAAAQWQLTTQTQTALVMLSDKSVIASGHLIGSGDGFVAGGNHIPTYLHSQFNLDPLDYKNGYLIGVEQIYLGGEASVDWSEDVYVSVCIELVVETLTSAKAVALAMSQQ